MRGDSGPPHRQVRVLVGSLTFVLFALNTLFWCVFLFAVTLAKLLVPVFAWRGLCSRALVRIAEGWTAVNSWGLAVTQPTLLEGHPSSHACYDSRLIVVGNLDNSGKKHKNSNYGKIVDYWENGTNKKALGIEMTGTSQSTAIISGKIIKQMGK